MIIVQLLITFTGVVAVWLSLCKTDRVRRWGPVFGLLGQPFWFTLFLKNDQPLMLGICGLYTFTWARGFWMFWIKPSSLMRVVRWLRQRRCKHGCHLSDLRRTPDGNVECPCIRCGKILTGAYGLILECDWLPSPLPETAPERCCLLPPNHAGDCRF